jgi:hypothetical protein
MMWEIMIDHSTGKVQEQENKFSRAQIYQEIIKIYTQKRDCEWTYWNDPMLLFDFEIRKENK